MSHSHNSSDDSAISELSIVDTFTRLIFGDEDGYNRHELSVIQALRMVDLTVLGDSHRDMGAYLREMEVGEMIELVGRVRRQLATMSGVLSVAGEVPPRQRAGINRRA